MEDYCSELPLTDKLNEPIEVEGFEKRLAEELEERTEFAWASGSGCSSGGWICYNW
jgi:hypothetical protein